MYATDRKRETKPTPKTDFIMGVDLGQAQDYTAVVVLEREARETGEIKERHHTGSRISYGDGRPSVGGDWTEKTPVMINYFTARYLERLPLGTPYPEQVRQIKNLYERLRDDGKDVSLAVDATGVGRPVVDMLTQARLPVTAISITAGDAVAREGGDYRVPKRDLASVVQVLLQTGRLKIDKTLLEANILTAELEGFKYNITASGHDRYGNDVAAWREAAHDDMVLAVAVACWYGENVPPYIEPKRYGSRIRSGSTF
jgi:hypothetical protein